MKYAILITVPVIEADSPEEAARKIKITATEVVSYFITVGASEENPHVQWPDEMKNETT